MAEVYNTQPKPHRNGVTTVDAADPADTGEAIDCRGYKECRLDIDISGEDIAGLQVQALFWNPRQQRWFGGGRRVFTNTGRHSLVVDSRGAMLFLKVTAFTGTSFSLQADYSLS
jgi:hypothetical protein